MVAWNETKTRTEWLRKQGRGAKSYAASLDRSDWFCDGCQRYHRYKTCRFIRDGKMYCVRTF